MPRVSVVVLALMLAVAGCEAEGDAAGDKSADAGSTGNSLLEDRACPPDSTATWANFGEGFLLNHCNACHSSKLGKGERGGAPVGVDFDTADGVWKHYLRIHARSGGSNDTMPPIADVSAKERARLADWIACGMKGLPGGQ